MWEQVPEGKIFRLISTQKVKLQNLFIFTKFANTRISDHKYW